MNNIQQRKEYSERIGNRAEDLFVKICQKKGCSVYQASKREDIFEHWDRRVISPSGKNTLVDVKAMKDGRYDFTYLELIGNTGKNGWLLGKADLIAFQQEYGFLLFSRINLLNWVIKKAQIQSVKQVRDLYSRFFDKQGHMLESFRHAEGYNLFARHKDDALYKLYSRPPWGDKPRHDVTIKARIQDMLNEIKYDVLK